MQRSLLLFLALMGCSPKPAEPVAGPLRAGLATVLVNAPVGAPTGGNSQHKGPDDQGSRWAQNFPGTRGVHTDATARAMAFTNGLARTALVRLDVCLATPSLRTRIRQKLDEANEPALFVIQGTHTHSQVARFFEPVHLGTSSGPDFISFGMDVYDPELDDRLATAAAESVIKAFSDLKPVSVGSAVIEAGMLNGDRRCENDPLYGPNYRDTKMTIVRVDEVDEAGTPTKPLGALLHFTAHGTILDRGNGLLSTDAPGAMELGASDALGVPVIFMQGAAGDVSPAGSPNAFEGTQRLEWLGRVAGRLARKAYDEAAPGTAPREATLVHVDRGMLMTRERLGYPRGEFPETGAIGCQVGGREGKDPCGSIVTPPDQAGLICVPIEPRPRFKVPMTLLQVADVALITLPGEPSTAVGAKVGEALAPLGAKRGLVLGYAQDHYGYLLEQEDFLRGGYESTVSPWGWRLGAFLIDETRRLVETRTLPQEAPDPATPPAVVPRAVEESEGSPAIVTDAADVERTQTAVFVFNGGDPGLGSPSVSLEREVDGTFEPAMASAFRPLVNGPEIVRRYLPIPLIVQLPVAPKRTHQWTARWELVPTQALGRYRFVATGRAKVDGVVQRYQLVSKPFEVKQATSITTLDSRVLPDGRVVVSARYAPNPMQSTAGDPTANLRLWDEDSRPTLGMTARGGTVRVSVRQGAGAPTSMTVDWSDAEKGYLVTLPSGMSELLVEPRALVDALGNTNGRALTVTVTR